MEKIKYYSKYDMINSYELNLIENKIQKNLFIKEEYDINEVLEFFNIIKFIQNEVYLSTWSEKDIENYKKISKELLRKIGKYIHSINDLNIAEIFSAIDRIYIDDFWEIFEKFSLYKRIAKESIIKILNSDKNNIYYVFKYKKIIRKYKEELKNFLMENDLTAELLLKEYIEESKLLEEHLFFSEVLTLEDKNYILEKYINSDNIHFNYLELIIKGGSSPELLISSKLKLKAKQKYEAESKKIFSNGNNFSYGVGISFSETQEKSVEYSLNKNNLDIELSYSLKWIKENLDYPTILNNFIYLFEFTDFQFRFTHISHRSTRIGLSDFIKIEVKRGYKKNEEFNINQMMINLKMRGYYYILQKNNIYLEKVLEWFFHEYLKEEFKVEGFKIHLPDIKLTYLEKCKIIVSEIESILKQFKLYVEEKEINRELLEMTSEHLFFKDIYQV